MKTNTKPQASKDALDRRTRAMVDRAGSNAGGPHRLRTEHRRKPKHFKGWDWD